MTREELLSVLDDAVAALGTALALHVQLQESVGGYAQTLKRRIDGLESKLAADKARWEKTRAAEKRKEELERDNQERNSEKSSVEEGRLVQVPIFNQRQQVIGWIKSLGNGAVDILNSKGQTVAREFRGSLSTQRANFKAGENKG